MNILKECLSLKKEENIITSANIGYIGWSAAWKITHPSMTLVLMTTPFETKKYSTGNVRDENINLETDTESPSCDKKKQTKQPLLSSKVWSRHQIPNQQNK